MCNVVVYYTYIYILFIFICSSLQCVRNCVWGPLCILKSLGAPNPNLKLSDIYTNSARTALHFKSPLIILPNTIHLAVILLYHLRNNDKGEI